MYVSNVGMYVCHCMSVCLPVRPSVRPSAVCLFVYLFACLPACLSVCMHVYLSICMPAFLCISRAECAERLSKSKNHHISTSGHDEQVTAQRYSVFGLHIDLGVYPHNTVAISFPTWVPCTKAASGTRQGHLLTNVIKPLEPNISVTCFSSVTCRAGLLQLEGRTRRATDAAIPELNVNGSTSVDFKT